MSINPSLYASPGGMGPQTGGYNPTPVDAMASRYGQESSSEFMEYARYSDARTKAISGLLATGIAGDSDLAEKLLKDSKQGQFIKDIAATVVSSGIVPGGSPLQLAQGVQQMVASQGFTVGGNIGRGSPVFGGGAITDMMSKSVFDSVKDNFFDSVTGLSKRNAHGLDQSQMGDAMNVLTSRGAFRGMDIGEIDMNESGVYEFKRNEGKMEKVNKIFTDYAGMLKDARQIFGDLPVSELTQNAERLVGTSLREMGAVSTMRNRMANIKATSSAYGLNPEAVAGQMMRMTDTVESSMFQKAANDPRVASEPHLMALTATAFGKTAANIAESSVLSGIHAGHSATTASNIYAEQGKYMPTISSDAASKMMSQTMTEIASPRDKRVTGNVLAAQAMLSTGAIKDPKVAAQAQELITKMGNTGDVKQQSILNQQLARTINEGGGDIERFKAVYTSTEMMNMMSPEGHSKYSKFLGDTASNRLAMEGTKNLNIAKQDYGLFRQDQAGYKNREAFTELITSVDKKAQDALFSAVGPGGEIDEEKLNKAYETTPALDKVMPKEKFKQTISQFSQDPNRKQGNLNEQMVDILDTARSNPRFSALGSTREKTLAAERAVQTYLSSTSLGEGMDKEDFGTELVRGFFGAGKIDNNVVLESLRNKDKLSTFDISADKTSLNMDAKGVERLSESIGADNMKAIANKLNVNPEDKEALAKKLSTVEGFQALQANTGGAVMAVDKEGKLAIGSAKDVDSETKELEIESMVTAAKRLVGEDKKEKISGDLSTIEGREQYNKDIVKELTADDSERLVELSDKFKKDGYGGAEFESLRLMAQSNPNISAAITKSAEEARAEGGTENIQKYNDLMAMNRQIQSSGSESGKYLGVLEIMSEGLAQLKLFQD